MSEGLIAIGGLWLKEGKKGKYFSGEIELEGVKQHILIFRNDKGDNPKRPDYRIHMPEPVDDDEPISPPKDDFEDDSIPF